MQRQRDAETETESDRKTERQRDRKRETHKQTHENHRLIGKVGYTLTITHYTFHITYPAEYQDSLSAHSSQSMYPR